MTPIREAQVRRMLDAYRAQRAEILAGHRDGPEHRQATARLAAARRNASREEVDEFIEQSLDHVLGPRCWRNGPGAREGRSR